MMKHENFLALIRRMSLALVVCISLIRCADEEELLPEPPVAEPVAEAVIEDPVTQAAESTSCNCTYIVPADKYLVDGKALDLKPGNVICLDAATNYKNLLFKNIVGTADKPIIIRNCGGTAKIKATGLSYGIKTERSRYFKITGGTASKIYGIQIDGGHMGITLENLSSDFEVDHVEAFNSGFAGIMAKTDPSCDDATIRGNFVMQNILLHDNYIHNTGGEGFYVGNSFFETGAKTNCGIRMPHEIHHVKLYNNTVENTGWEGIQVGAATKGAEIYNNTVENYGTVNRVSQNNGIQIGAGTGGVFYNNLIKNGLGNGLIVLGLGDNVIHNNVIINAGEHGVFCDERYTPGSGFKFINNTIINPKKDGIRIYADKVPMNVIINNIIVNPGSYSTYKAPRTGNDAFVYKVSSAVKVEMSNNYFTRNINDVKFLNAGAGNYKLTSTSPAVNQGTNIAVYNVLKDFYQQVRLNGAAYDIGASEY